jgi:hypothetical protein
MAGFNMKRRIDKLEWANQIPMRTQCVQNPQGKYTCGLIVGPEEQNPQLRVLANSRPDSVGEPWA